MPFLYTRKEVRETETYEFVSLVLNSVLTMAAAYAGIKFKEFRKREKEREKRLRETQEARDDLQVAMARCIIIRECNHYIKKGFAPLYAVESISAMYKAYHSLGGNGAIKEIYGAFCKLPHIAPGGEHEEYK